MGIRVLAWFSCGAASAYAAKKAIEKYGDAVEVVYCDTLKHEHPDNLRFLRECGRWIGREVKILRSEKFSDIYDVFERTGFLVGPKGAARCTVELKKRVRFAYQRPDDIHIFGYTAEEGRRIERFRAQNFEAAEFPLHEQGVSKADCLAALAAAGIELPAMYRLGYQNNNCIGCVKGGMAYWNKIRRDFPDAFARMAALERKLGATVLSKREKGQERRRLYLDELQPNAGRGLKEPDIECGVLCETNQGEV